MNNLVFIPKIGCKAERGRTNLFSRIFILDTVNHYEAVTHLTKKAYLRTEVIFPYLNMKEYFDCNSWKKSYAILDKIAYKIDQVIVMANDLYASMHRGCDLHKFYEKTLEKDDWSMNFVMSKKVYKYVCGIIHLSKRIPVKYICFDPQEAVYDPEMTWFFYNLYDYKYFPNVEYGHFFTGNRIGLKTNKFVFGATVQHHDRDWLDKFIKTLPPKVFYRNKFTNRNNVIPYCDYVKWLEKSEFTLIIPSYDKDAFSAIRFFEALAKGCIPLIHKDVKLGKWARLYPDFAKILKEHVWNGKFPSYNAMLKKYMHSTSYKKLCDINYYQSHLRGFLSWRKK